MNKIIYKGYHGSITNSHEVSYGVNNLTNNNTSHNMNKI
jgi:hypothetical protein